jgi:hypothetical protein
VTESVALPIETWAVTSEQLPVTKKQIIANSVIADLIRTGDDVIAGLTRNPIRILLKLLFFICL